MKQAIDDRTMHPGSYNLYFRNCAGLVEHVLHAEENGGQENRKTGENRGQTGLTPFFFAQYGNGVGSRDPEIAGSPAKFESFLIFSANGPLRSRRRG